MTVDALVVEPVAEDVAVVDCSLNAVSYLIFVNSHFADASKL